MRTVVVTGGKRGIGAAISAAFAGEHVIPLSSADLDVTDEEAVARVFREIGAVDVLACHIPPAVPGLLYDVEARRFERGSEAVLDAIRDTAPGLVLFGHVHQPLQSRVRIGRTECVNVGYFRGSGRPYVLEWQ